MCGLIAGFLELRNLSLSVVVCELSSAILALLRALDFYWGVFVCLFVCVVGVFIFVGFVLFLVFCFGGGYGR